MRLSAPVWVDKASETASSPCVGMLVGSRQVWDNFQSQTQKMFFKNGQLTVGEFIYQYLTLAMVSMVHAGDIGAYNPWSSPQCQPATAPLRQWPQAHPLVTKEAPPQHAMDELDSTNRCPERHRRPLENGKIMGTSYGNILEHPWKIQVLEIVSPMAMENDDFPHFHAWVWLACLSGNSLDVTRDNYCIFLCSGEIMLIRSDIQWEDSITQSIRGWSLLLG